MDIICIILGIRALLNGIAGVILRMMHYPIQPIDFRKYHVLMHTGGYFNFSKYPPIWGSLGVGKTGYLIVGGILLILLGVMKRRLKKAHPSIEDRRNRKGMRIFGLVVIVLLVEAFVVPALIERTVQVEDYWGHLWGKGVILHAPSQEQYRYYQSLAIALSSVFAVCAAVFDVFRIADLTRKRWLAVLIFPFLIALALAGVWYVYPFIGILMPLFVLVLFIALIGVISSVFDNMGNDSSEEDEKPRLTDVLLEEYCKSAEAEHLAKRVLSFGSASGLSDEERELIEEYGSSLDKNSIREMLGDRIKKEDDVMISYEDHDLYKNLW